MLRLLRSAKALLFTIVALAPATVYAQSSPGLTTGQTPTAAQWNSYFAAKVDTTNGVLTTPTIINGNLSGTLNLPGETWTATSGKPPILQNVSFTGDTSSGAAAFGMFLQQFDSSACTTSNICSGIREALNLEAGSLGARAGGQFTLNVAATTANSRTNAIDYTALIGDCQMSATDNVTYSAYSSCFGANIVSFLEPGITENQNVGIEIDTGAGSGSSQVDNIGMQIVALTPYNINASRDDDGLIIGSQFDPTSTTGYKVGLDFGGGAGYMGVRTTGTLIYGQGLIGSTFTVANGIDWHLGTFTGNSWNDGHIMLTGAGDALLDSASTLATAATAGFVHLPHTTAAPTGTPTNTTGPACEWNTTSHSLNCYDGTGWFHVTATSGAN